MISAKTWPSAKIGSEWYEYHHQHSSCKQIHRSNGNNLQKNVSKEPSRLLHRYVKQQRWEEARQLLQNCDGKINWTEQDLRNGWNVLHMTCFSNPPLDVVQLILAFCPMLTLQTDYSGDTALFYASWKSSEEVVLHYLRIASELSSATNHNNNILFTPSHYGSLPLHYSLCHKRSPKIINYMLQRYPEALRQQDRFCKTPLHRFYHAWNADVKQYLHSQHNQVKIFQAPDKVSSDSNLNGWESLTQTFHILLNKLPIKSSISVPHMYHNDDVDDLRVPTLHQVLALPDHIVPSIFKQLYIHLHPSQIINSDHNGNLPLHIAATNPHSQVISTLLKLYPDAAKIPNHKNNLYPVCIAAIAAMSGTSNDAQLNTIYELLQFAPEVIQMMTTSQSDPSNL